MHEYCKSILSCAISFPSENDFYSCPDRYEFVVTIGTFRNERDCFMNNCRKFLSTRIIHQRFVQRDILTKNF